MVGDANRELGGDSPAARFRRRFGWPAIPLIPSEVRRRSERYGLAVPDAMLFERDPERYRRGRPPYPEVLWALLARVGIARPGARVLDLGAGTGQATGPLLAMGARVDAVEPGEGLARLLTAQFPSAHLQVAAAETATYPPAAYDGVVCATALHWLDLDVVLPQIHRTLRPDGWFIPFWNVYFNPDSQPTPFRQVVNSMFGGPPTTGGTPLDERHWSQILTRDGFFKVDAVHVWSWEHTMTGDQMADLVRTFNGWTDGHISAAVEAVDRFGGTVTERYSTIAYLCRRVED